MKPKLLQEHLERAAVLRAQGLTHNAIRNCILEEYGINVARPTLVEAMSRHEEKLRRAAILAKVELEEARMMADAARNVAFTVAAGDAGDDAKLIQLRLAAIVGRADGAWAAMSAADRSDWKVWSKLEDLVLKYLFIKLRLGGSLAPTESELETLDKTILGKLESLARKPPKAPPAAT